MPWTPTQLSKSQLEERRYAAAKLFKQNKLNKASIAKELNVSRAAITKWHQQWQKNGKTALKAKHHPGKQSKLSPEDQTTLINAIKQNPETLGFSTQRWTCRRITEVCERLTGTTYHPDHMRKIMQNLGFSPQRPQIKSTQRDEQAIGTWLRKTHRKTLKKGVRKTPPSSTLTKQARVREG